MTPTSAMREPTKAERETAEAVYLAWCARGGWDWRDLVVKALAAASDAMKERAARYHIERAQVHARDATWIGPNRERYEGARVEGVEMSPMNGPAIAYDREMADAAAIRALTPEPPSEKENEGG